MIRTTDHQAIDPEIESRGVLATDCRMSHPGRGSRDLRCPPKASHTGG
jgi:hypothetical protein